jgi:F-type H+-transporting ATPase subunit delta
MAAFVSRYASAFLDVVTSAKLDPAATDRQLADFLDTWNGSPELREFLSFLDKLNTKMGLEKELRNLLAVLIDNGRIASVAEVAAAYRRLLQDQLGIRQAEIITARELDYRERESLLADVARLAGARIEASFKLDKSILGGTVVRIGSTVYDGSVRGRLDRLKEALVSS